MLIVGTKNDVSQDSVMAAITELGEEQKTEVLFCSAKLNTNIEKLRENIFLGINEHINSAGILDFLQPFSENQKLYDALLRFDEEIKKFPSTQYKKFLFEVRDLLRSIVKPEKAIQALDRFRKNCHKHLDQTQHNHVNKNILKAVGTVVFFIAIVFVVFVLGLIAGTWAGPAAFFTVLLSASLAVKFFLGASVLGGSIYAGFTCFSGPYENSIARSVLRNVDSQAKDWIKNNELAKLDSDTSLSFLRGYFLHKEHRYERTGKSFSNSKTYALAKELYVDISKGLLPSEALAQQKYSEQPHFFSKISKIFKDSDKQLFNDEFHSVNRQNIL